MLLYNISYVHIYIIYIIFIYILLGYKRVITAVTLECICVHTTSTCDISSVQWCHNVPVLLICLTGHAFDLGTCSVWWTDSSCSAKIFALLSDGCLCDVC